MILISLGSLGVKNMPAVTIRNLSEETHRALKVRAANHGRSTEAEIRDILEHAALPEDRLKIGSALAAFGRSVGGLELDIHRDKSMAKPVSFE
jgi:plasmid stability protein